LPLHHRGEVASKTPGGSVFFSSAAESRGFGGYCWTQILAYALGLDVLRL
jgi:hypothetical protein